GLYVFAGLVSFIFAVNYLFEWDNYFRFRHAQNYGETDPIFGNDFGFYIFTLPFIEGLQISMVFLSFFTSLIVFMFYFLSGSVHVQSGKLFGSFAMSKGVRTHIFTNVGIWLLFLALGYYLRRY